MVNSLKGSTWGIWDLHIHTPYSELNNGFGEDWDTYVKELFSKAILHNVRAIGITDYFCIEGYKKLKTEYLNSPEKLNSLFTKEEQKKIKDILILPNIEFRLSEMIDNSKVNFHIIFSDKVAIRDIEENFLHELEFSYQGVPSENDEKWKLKLSNLGELGQKLKTEQPEFQSQSDLFVGMNCAYVYHEQVSEILKNKRSKFEDKFLMLVPSDEDLSEICWTGQGHQIRKVLIQKAHALFASNPNTIKWGLGALNEEGAFVKEFNTLKPCLWGSDAHNFEKLFKPDLNRYCWVKAIPAFEGLRQVLYEPKDRVFIGEIRPEDNKNSYQTIESIKFEDENFTPNLIPLNSNLVTIIGGKSTGKSVFLRNIAQTIDPIEVEQRLQECAIPQYASKVQGLRLIGLMAKLSIYQIKERFQKKLFIFLNLI